MRRELLEGYHGRRIPGLIIRNAICSNPGAAFFHFRAGANPAILEMEGSTRHFCLWPRSCLRLERTSERVLPSGGKFNSREVGYNS